jgi:hypothetical protein
MDPRPLIMLLSATNSFTTSPISWAPGTGQNYARVDVPVGFVTDLASIPQIFFSVLPRDRNYSFAAIIQAHSQGVSDGPSYDVGRVQNERSVACLNESRFARIDYPNVMANPRQS